MDQFRTQVEEIMKKPVVDEADIAILRARESYLTAEEKEKFLPVEKVVVKKKK